MDTHSTYNIIIAKFAARRKGGGGRENNPRAANVAGPETIRSFPGELRVFHLAERASGRMDMYANWRDYSHLTVIFLWIAPQFLNSDGRVSGGKYIQHPLIVFNSVSGMFTYFILLLLARKVINIFLVCLL